MSGYATIMVIFAGLFLLHYVIDAQNRIDKLEKTVAERERRMAPYDSEKAHAEAVERGQKAKQAAIRLEAQRATEKTIRNREVKRRQKERKATALAERMKERNEITLRAVVESLEHEQALRNQKAAEHGWPVHPNDVDWLDETERKSMYRAFIDREPFRLEWQNPHA